MKRFLATVLSVTMLLSSTVFANTIEYNNEEISYTDQQPVIINDRTYVPIRDVFEKIGYTVDWDADSKLVTISLYDSPERKVLYSLIMVDTANNVCSTLDRNYKVNVFDLTDPVQIVNERTMLPLREILESAGFEISFDEETKAVNIVKGESFGQPDEYTKDSHVFDFDSDVKGASEKFEQDYAGNTSGTLTEEEKAYFEGLSELLNSYNNLSIEKDELDSEQIKALISGFVEKTDSITCPDSVKAINESLKNYLLEASDCMIKLFEYSKKYENIAPAMSFSNAIACVVRVALVSEPFYEELNKFNEEKNVDLATLYPILSKEKGEG